MHPERRRAIDPSYYASSVTAPDKTLITPHYKPRSNRWPLITGALVVAMVGAGVATSSRFNGGGVSAETEIPETYSESFSQPPRNPLENLGIAIQNHTTSLREAFTLDPHHGKFLDYLMEEDMYVFSPQPIVVPIEVVAPQRDDTRLYLIQEFQTFGYVVVRNKAKEKEGPYETEFELIRLDQIQAEYAVRVFGDSYNGIAAGARIKTRGYSGGVWWMYTDESGKPIHPVTLELSAPKLSSGTYINPQPQ